MSDIGILDVQFWKARLGQVIATGDAEATDWSPDITSVPVHVDCFDANGQRGGVTSDLRRPSPASRDRGKDSDQLGRLNRNASRPLC